MALQEEYLGDGLYVSFDGYSIWLRAPREHGDHVVALEPPVWRALTDFVKKLAQDADSTEAAP